MNNQPSGNLSMILDIAMKNGIAVIIALWLTYHVTVVQSRQFEKTLEQESKQTELMQKHHELSLRLANAMETIVKQSK